MIKIEIDDRQVLDALRRLQEAGTDLRPAFQALGEYLVESTKRRFAEGRAPDGSPWVPNSPATLARKRGSRPLIGESRRLGNEIHYRAGPTSLELGSSLEYAAVQQFGARKGQFGRNRRGSPIPWGDIPPRPFLGLSETDQATVLEIIQEHLEAAPGL